MAADASKYGITQPLDEAPPHDGDEDSSAALVTVLKALGVYESQEGSRRRASLIDDVAAECQHRPTRRPPTHHSGPLLCN